MVIVKCPKCHSTNITINFMAGLYCNACDKHIYETDLEFIEKESYELNEYKCK
jgi:hypothetical protein